MGNAPSNRKITVVNDEVAGVIKISDSVVRRLKGELEQGGEEKKIKIHQPVHQKEEISEPPAPAPQTSVSPAPPPVKIPVTEQVKDARPYENFMEEAHLTALKIRQEKEAEIRRVEEHWRTQLLNLTNHYNQLAQLTEAEYRAAVEDVERSFSKESFTNVCSEQKDRVLKCYQEHKDQPLHCASQVKEFAACVQKFRLDSLDKPER